MYQATKDTSKAAYHSIERPTKKTLHADIMRVIEEKGTAGITAGWIGRELGVVNSTIGARIVELEEANRLFRIEKTAANPSGRQANLIVSNSFRSSFRHEEIAPPVKYNKIRNAVPNTIEGHKAAKNTAFIVELEAALSEGRFISPHSDWHKRAKALIA